MPCGLSVQVVPWRPKRLVLHAEARPYWNRLNVHTASRCLDVVVLLYHTSAAYGLAQQCATAHWCASAKECTTGMEHAHEFGCMTGRTPLNAIDHSAHPRSTMPSQLRTTTLPAENFTCSSQLARSDPCSIVMCRALPPRVPSTNQSKHCLRCVLKHFRCSVLQISMGNHHTVLAGQILRLGRSLHRRAYPCTSPHIRVPLPTCNLAHSGLHTSAPTHTSW